MARMPEMGRLFGDVRLWNKNRWNTSQLFDSYVASRRALGVSPRTIETYTYRLGAFVRAHPKLPQDPEAIERWITRYAHLTPETRDKHHQTIRAFYSWLVKRQILAPDKDPFLALSSPRVPKKVPRILTIQDLEAIKEASKPPFERALILALLDSMARVGDVAGLTKDALVGDAIRLVGKSGQRIVPLHPLTASYLRELPTRYLFPRHAGFGMQNRRYVDAPMKAANLSDAVHRVMVRAGLTGPKLGPHIIRHSAATAYIEAGGDIESLRMILGHTSIETTKRYVSLSTGSIRTKHAQHGVMTQLLQKRLTNKGARVLALLPRVTLPETVARARETVGGAHVNLLFVADAKQSATYYYIKGKANGRLWTLARLGVNLPHELAEAYRMAVAEENERRSARRISGVR